MAVIAGRSSSRLGRIRRGRAVMGGVKVVAEFIMRGFAADWPRSPVYLRRRDRARNVGANRYQRNTRTDPGLQRTAARAAVKKLKTWPSLAARSAWPGCLLVRRITHKTSKENSWS